MTRALWWRMRIDRQTHRDADFRPTKTARLLFTAGLHSRIESIIRLLLLFVHLCQKRINGLVHGVAADVAIADHALGVEDVDGRPPADFPFVGDRPLRAAAVPK